MTDLQDNNIQKLKFLPLTILLWCISALFTLAVGAAEQQIRQGTLVDFASLEQGLIVPYIKNLNHRPQIDPEYVAPIAEEMVVILDQQLVVVDRRELQVDIDNGFFVVNEFIRWPRIFETLTSAGAQAITRKQAMGKDIISAQLADTITLNVPDTGNTSSPQSSSSATVVVVVDGILMEMPYWVVIGLIRNVTFIVLPGSWTIDLMGDVGAVDCEDQPFHPLCRDWNPNFP